MSKKGDKFVTALVANGQGEFFDLDGYAAVGMAGSHLTPLVRGNTIAMPYGGEHLFLPDRSPIVYNINTMDFEVLRANPYASGEQVFPVAAFNVPGYTTTLVSAFAEGKGAQPLPLFSYGAVGWLGQGFRVASLKVDSERRQDLRLMPMEKVRTGVRKLRHLMPSNRLRKHLETCALTYGCPAGKNFFLGRYEAPLPTSRQCNARCWGCLSLQKDSPIPCTQKRITFTPSPEEIAQIAIHHIKKTKRAVVSFGQGCEGEPLLAAEVIEPAIRLVRKAVGNSGTINMNTNGSLPQALDGLFRAGLDSVRVSMNSVRRPCYEAYFRPKGYRFDDVVESIDVARRRGKHVAINYLNLPGFSDSESEIAALLSFLHNHPVSMIQWRNLNFDPVRYWQIMAKSTEDAELIGIPAVLETVRTGFPTVKFGYFNPPREKFGTKLDG